MDGIRNYPSTIHLHLHTPPTHTHHTHVPPTHKADTACHLSLPLPLSPLNPPFILFLTTCITLTHISHSSTTNNTNQPSTLHPTPFGHHFAARRFHKPPPINQTSVDTLPPTPPRPAINFDPPCISPCYTLATRVLRHIRRPAPQSSLKHPSSRWRVGYSRARTAHIPVCIAHPHPHYLTATSCVVRYHVDASEAYEHDGTNSPPSVRDAGRPGHQPSLAQHLAAPRPIIVQQHG